jgi:hypothetical protein
MENPKNKKKLALKLKTVRSLDLERVTGGAVFTTINTRDLAGINLADPPQTQPKSNYPNVCATRCGDGVLCPGDSRIAAIDLRTIGGNGGGRLQSLFAC